MMAETTTTLTISFKSGSNTKTVNVPNGFAKPKADLDKTDVTGFATYYHNYVDTGATLNTAYYTKKSRSF